MRHGSWAAEVVATARKVPRTAHLIRSGPTHGSQAFHLWSLSFAGHVRRAAGPLDSVPTWRYQQQLRASASHTGWERCAGAAYLWSECGVGRVAGRSRLAMTRRAPGGITTDELLLPLV
jgi:hypothetical protein